MSAYHEMVLSVRRQWMEKLSRMDIDEMIDEWSALNRQRRVHVNIRERSDTSRQIEMLMALGTYIHGTAFLEGLRDATGPQPWNRPETKKL